MFLDFYIQHRFLERLEFLQVCEFSEDKTLVQSCLKITMSNSKAQAQY